MGTPLNDHLTLFYIWTVNLDILSHTREAIWIMTDHRSENQDGARNPQLSLKQYPLNCNG